MKSINHKHFVLFVSMSLLYCASAFANETLIQAAKNGDLVGLQSLFTNSREIIDLNEKGEYQENALMAAVKFPLV